jgi:hypothetical protein
VDLDVGGAISASPDVEMSRHDNAALPVSFPDKIQSIKFCNTIRKYMEYSI